MKKNKINKKACTSCGLEAAVARKVCAGCNTPFYTKRPTYYYEVKDGVKLGAEAASSSGASSSTAPDNVGNTFQDENGRRRTERVKREKPHFYDALEFERKYKKRDKSAKVAGKPNKVSATKLKKKVKRLEVLKMREALIEAEDEQIYESILTPSKTETLGIILEEINHKLLISAWKP